MFTVAPGLLAPSAGGAGYTLSATNALAGLASSAFAAVAPFNGFTASKVNDGVELTPGNIAPSSYGNTLNNSAASNNGHGVQITFGAAKRLGRMKISSYRVADGAVGDFQVQYHNGTTWVNAGSAVAIAGTTAFAFQQVDFNLTAAITATLWRIVLANWSGSSNFYAGELQAFEWV